MAVLDVRDLRNMTVEELNDAIEDKREEIFNLRFQMAANQLEDANQLRYAKRDLARLLTIQREQQLAQALARGDNNG